MNIYEELENLAGGVGVGVDAITYTTTTQIGHMAINAALAAVLPKVEDFKTTPFRTFGASGYAKGPVRYAEKVDARHKRLWAILMITGPLSNDVLRYGHLGIKATRLDLRVDVQLREKMVNLAERCYKVMGGEDSQARFIASMTGQTLYPNQSREATYYGRLYDKSLTYGAELGTVWRYEVEIKRRAAEGIQKILLECHDVETFITETVFGVFKEEWGIPVPAEGVKPKLNYVGMASVSAEQKLDWIKRNVAPTVKHLLTLGLDDEVIGALRIETALEEVKQREMFRDKDFTI